MLAHAGIINLRGTGCGNLRRRCLPCRLCFRRKRTGFRAILRILIQLVFGLFLLPRSHALHFFVRRVFLLHPRCSRLTKAALPAAEHCYPCSQSGRAALLRPGYSYLHWRFPWRSPALKRLNTTTFRKLWQCKGTQGGLRQTYGRSCHDDLPSLFRYTPTP